MPSELLMIFGPPAVGKMTVGRAICARSNFRLFHNHLTIEPLLEIFDYGTAPFQRLNHGFRRQVFTEAAGAGLRVIFTYVVDVEDPAEVVLVEELMAPFGAAVSFVELSADLSTRLRRNQGLDRLAEKKSKRDLDWSHAHVKDYERYSLNTVEGQASAFDELFARHRHLRLDNTAGTAEATAQRIVEWLE